MSIYLGSKKGKLYKGDYHPAQFYRGDTKIAGYDVVQKQGMAISGVNTYNDALNPTIEGKSEQTVTANSPSPDYPSPIRSSENFDVVSCGRNLMSQERWYKYLLSIAPSTVAIKSDLSHADYISMYCPAYASVSRFMRGEFLDRTQYTFSYWYKLETPLQEGIPYHTGIRIQYTDGTNGYGLVDYAHKTTQWVYVTLVSVVGQTIDYLYFLNSGNYPPWSGFADLQIEEGVTATPYQPYHATTAHVTDPLRSVGNVSDSIEVSVGKVEVVRRCEQYIADGIIKPSFLQVYTSPECAAFVIPALTGAKLINVGISTHMAKYSPEIATSQTTTEEVTLLGGISPSYTNVYFKIRKSRFPGWQESWTNAQKGEAFKQWLVAQKTAGTPVITQYILYEPTRTDITATPLGQALLALRTQPHYTQVYTNADTQPHLLTNVKTIDRS